MSDHKTLSVEEDAAKTLGLVEGKKLSKQEVLAKVDILRNELSTARSEMAGLKSFLAEQTAMFDAHMNGLREALVQPHTQEQEQQGPTGGQPSSE